MNIASLIPFAPYLTILYVVFALIQVLRRQHQGIVALILALIVLAAPIAAYFLSSNVTERLSMINAMALSAGVVFVASIIIGMLDRRNKDRRQRSSYGVIGTVMSFVMAIFIVVMPMTQTSAAGFPATGSQQNTNAQTQQGQETAFAKVLEAQTGLTANELTTQLSGSSTTIATLVSAHNGDLSAVTTALVTALDTLTAQDTRMTQMLSNIGSDSNDIATKLINGQAPAQAQRFLMMQLISGTMAPPQGGSQNGSGGSGQPFGASGTMAPPQGGSGQPISASGTDTVPMPPSGNGSNNGAPPATTPEKRAALPTNTPMPATLAPTEVVVRPTPITFPTATPTVEAAMAAQTTTDNTSGTTSTASSGATTKATAVTCTLATDFNLNLRDKPTTDGSNVLLSIPFGTTVTASGRTADDWYNVSYDGKTGWVSGQYTTAQASCSQLAQLTP